MKLLAACFLFALLFSVTQAQIPVGGWRLHLPTGNAVHVAYSPTKVYCTTGESLFSYNLNDNSVQELSKITGLSDFGVSAIAFSQELNLLVIGYSNGNIDIVKDKNIVNISDLKQKLMPASKSVNHILFDGKWAYLSCGFGMILLDLEKLEVKDTYIFGVNGSYIQVNSSTILNNEIYAATASGIYRADKSDPMLVDYSRWKRVNSIPNFDKAFLQVTAKDNILYAIYTNPAIGGDSVYYYRDNVWKSLNLNENTDIYHLNVSSDKIVVSTAKNIKIYSIDFQQNTIIEQYQDFGTAQPRETVTDPKGNLWIADFGNGLMQRKPDGNFGRILPNGPLSSKIKSFYFANDVLFATAGGTDVSFNNLYHTAEFSTFAGDEWRSFQNYGVSDYMDVITDPVDKELYYISSWGSGIFSYKNGEVVNHFDETNSTLQNAIPGGKFTRVWGMDFDKNGNLWMANSYVNNTLSVLKRDGTWVSFPLKNAINAEILGDVLIDDYNQVWVALLKGNGILVLNTNNTLENTDDDQFLRFKPKNAYGVVINNIYTLENDLDGSIWVGTDFGPVVYSDPDEVLEGNTDGKQPSLRRNDGTDIIDPLLGGEIIRSIAVDGANRKWLGTERGGAFLVSAEGDSSLLQFSMDNSPILSNTIIDIGIHDKTGEVFFGTDRGIISYRSTANKAEENFGDVYAFPNPVRPNYHGPITITGLIRDANVKITDIAGNLVYETTTLGGQVVWDGKNLDGRRVATGVYIIFCSNNDGSKTYITKLLFMN